MSEQSDAIKRLAPKSFFSTSYEVQVKGNGESYPRKLSHVLRKRVMKTHHPLLLSDPCLLLVRIGHNGKNQVEQIEGPEEHHQGEVDDMEGAECIQHLQSDGNSYSRRRELLGTTLNTRICLDTKIQRRVISSEKIVRALTFS